MAVSTVTTVDVSQALSACLAGVDGLRTFWWVADTARPDCCIVGLPTIDWDDADAGFCSATWSYPLTIVVSRNSDREAQETLSRLVSEVAQALNDAEPDGVFSMEPLNARPLGSVEIAGQPLPAYLVNVRIRA